jgi:hypothetical protein
MCPRNTDVTGPGIGWARSLGVVQQCTTRPLYEMLETGPVVLPTERRRARLVLGASRKTIGNLDFMNPFPALFVAPPPKGVWVRRDFSRNPTHRI